MAPFLALTTNVPAEEFSLFAQELFRYGWFAITNSMLFAIVVALVLIGFAQYATRQIKLVPEGAQNFAELVVESLFGFLEGILGYELLKKTFPFFATIFIFIVACNWSGLFPGVGTIGWGHGESVWTTHVSHPLVRSVNADVNMTLGLSLLFFLLWIIWSLQANGPWGVIKHVFFPDSGLTGIAALAIGVIFFFIGFIELLSILLRPVALTFRLFGNIFAGESMLDQALSAGPILSWIIPIPLYAMELLVGFIQALVFCLLTAVFTAMMCRHDDHEEGATH